MKKERNCGMNAGMYPTYQGAMPMMGQPMMQPVMPPMVSGMPQANYGVMSNSSDSQLDSINNRLSSLERRVSKLENTTPQVTPLNSYNDTNFYMM